MPFCESFFLPHPRALARTGILWSCFRADQRDHVAATATTGEAVPEIFGAVDDEGLGVIAVVDGTGADEALAARFQGRDHPAGAQHLLDGDEALEVGKV